MIASLRNGLVDGLTVTRHHRAVTAVRYRPRYVHFHVHANDGLSLSQRVSGVVALHSSGSRFVSTTPKPTTTETPAKEIPHTVSSSSQRKHKVDLRPGPVKPPKASSESSPTPKPAASVNAASEHPPTKSSNQPTSSHNVSSVHPDHSVIETAKEDYTDASKHGILAPPPEGASWAGRLIHQAKELFKFYWNGVKLINVNRRRVNAIQARVKGGGAPLSRWESRFIANFKLDALKLIPFALIIIIAEETIPLVVIYAPFLLPSTCLLPSQKERIENKRREKQTALAETMSTVFRDVHKRAHAEPDLAVEKLLDRSALISYNGIFSLSTFGFPQIRLHRIKKHLNNVAADDALLASENWGERLNALELREALEERGIVTADLSTEAMRARLHWWLAETSQTDSDPIRKRVVLVAANAIGKHEV